MLGHPCKTKVLKLSTIHSTWVGQLGGWCPSSQIGAILYSKIINMLVPNHCYPHLHRYNAIGNKGGWFPGYPVGLLIIGIGALRCLWVMLCVCSHDKFATPLELLGPKGFGHPNVSCYEKQWSVATQSHTWFKGDLLCKNDGYQLGLSEFAIPLTTKTTHKLIQPPSIYM